MRSFFRRQWVKQCVAALRRPGSGRPAKRGRRVTRPAVELLEDRVNPSPVSWTGNAGTLNWGDAHNWSNNAVPTGADDVTINKAGLGTISVGGQHSVHSLNDATAALSIAPGGSLEIGNGPSVSTLGRSVTVAAGATLTVDPGATVVLGNSAAGTSSPVAVTVAGTLNVGRGASVQAFETGTGGPVEILVGGTSGSLVATGARFERYGNVPDASLSSIRIAGGGNLTATDCVFGWDELVLGAGSTGQLRSSSFPTGLDVSSYTLVTIEPGAGDGDGTIAPLEDPGPVLYQSTGQATTTAAANVATIFSLSSQQVTLSATVTSGGTSVNTGTVTFTVFSAANVQLGSPVTSGTVSGGNASASFTIAGGTTAGIYTIRAVYNPGAGLQTSSDTTHSLVLVQAGTTTVATNATATFSTIAQSVTFNASVASGAIGVNEGTVTFTVFAAGNVQVGIPAISGTVANGHATATFTLPAGQARGTYTIRANYIPGPNYNTSSDFTHTLTVGKAATTTAAAGTFTDFSATSQSVTLSAAVTSGGTGVSQGTVTFTVLTAGNVQVGSPVTSATVSGGNASVSYTLPAGQPVGTYTVKAVYNPGADYLTSSDSAPDLEIDKAATSTAAATTLVTFSPGAQPVTLGAMVTSAGVGIVEGTVTFTVFAAGNVQVGSPVTSGTVSGGTATANYILPAGQAPGTYTIRAVYNAGPDYLSSSDSLHTLDVVLAPTVVVVPNASVLPSPNPQSVTLSATVVNVSGTINDGTVTFTVFTAGNVQVGVPVTSGTVANGTATATFTVPGGQATGAYTIRAAYSGGISSPPATGTGQLAVDIPPVLPAINGGNPVTLPHGQFPKSIPLGASSPVGLPLSYTTSAVGVDPVYDLQQQYQFQGVGTFTAGATAYVLHSNQPGPGFLGYYLLRADGALYPYDGSGSYTHSFATGTPLAILGANFFADPTLLTSARPPVDYPALYNLQQQYQFQGVGTFTAGATAYVLHSNQPGPGFLGYYLLRPDGALFAYDGSGSYPHSFASAAPLANLGAAVYASPDVLLNAQAAPSLYATLYRLNRQYDLQQIGGSFYTNTLGHQAKWLYSPALNQYGQYWYTLTLSANGTQAFLRAWQGYQDSTVGALLATLDPAVYNNPLLVTNATAMPYPAVNATVNGAGTLSVAPADPAFLGSFKLTVTASDGLLSVSQTVLVTVTDVAPTLTVKQNGTTIPPGGTQTVPHLGTATDTVTTADADGDAVTTTATVSGFNLPFTLQQRYQFKGLGYFTTDATAYVLQAVDANAFGNPYYLLKSDGGLYAYDGSGSYASTYTNAPVAALGANVYADPMLLLNARPAVDYATLFNLQQQYQFQGVGTFTAGTTAYVLHSDQSGPGFLGYYLLGADGTLVPYDGSGSYSHSFANGTPLATLDPSVYVNPSLLLNAKAAPGLYAQLSELVQRYDLQQIGGSFFTGLRGHAAKWLYSPVPNANGQNFYTLVLSADGTRALLYAWDGGTDSVPAGGQPVAVLDASVYADPTLLTNAMSPPAATGVTASVAGGVLTLNAPASFVGTFQVTVTATDGVRSTSQTFLVHSTDTPPLPATIPAKTASRSGAPLQVTLASTDAEGDAVTYSAQAVGYNAAYDLQQVYRFTGVGYATNGSVTAYVLQSSVLGGSGGFYLLKSDGGVYAYDGSGSYANTFANAANLVTTLDPGVYNNPSLLTLAQAPAPPAAVVSVNGNTLTVNVAGVSAGTVFRVVVSAFDGAETSRTGFLVTVTA